MKADRFLTFILVGIGLLIVLSLALFFIRQGSQAYSPDSTPDGVAHNFILALLRSDYAKAYTYLAKSETGPTLDQFQASFAATKSNFGDASVQVGAAAVAGDTATVPVILVYSSGNLFNGANRQSQNAQLILQNGAWKVANMPYPFWDYSWGQPGPPTKEPAAPAQPIPAPIQPTLESFTPTP